MASLARKAKASQYTFCAALRIESRLAPKSLASARRSRAHALTKVLPSDETRPPQHKPEEAILDLESIALYRLEVPLTKPYRLAFGPVHRYETIVAALTDRDGHSGFGEATVLTGYTDETIEDAWQVARGFARELATLGASERLQAVTRLAATHPFTASAFGTALEMLDAPGALSGVHAKVPLVGLLDAKGDDAIQAQLDALLAGGYRTIKVKVGFDVADDLEFVRGVQRAARGRVLIRVDANQGYSRDQALAFVRGLAPDSIELFEQPCAAGDWDAHLAVAGAAGVPLMLDESIYGIADIEKAAALKCAQFIKVKLMKFGTLRALRAALARIRELGMRPVLGNGVACDLGCWLEACVAAGEIDNAGEMNGFLKVRDALFECPLRFDAGAIALENGYAPGLSDETVRRVCVDSLKIGTAAAAATSAA